MSEKIFKGFKQVTRKTFDDATDKSGYLWFVRTEVPEIEGSNDVSNDEYDIYFGSRHYGHFCEGELESIETKITSLEGKHDNEVKEILETLSSATETMSAQASAITENAVNIKEINDNLDLKADAASLASYISSVEYTEDKKIVFKNVDGTQLGEVDATPFIKDGILDDVEVVTITSDDIVENNPHGLVEGEKYIKFVWNTDGESKEDYILASEIGATYEGSDSIEISSNNKIEVKQVSGEKVSVTEIPVGGTPLAEILLEKNITTINSGNLQTVLESLFSQNNWASNPKRNIPTSLTVSMSTPSISLDKSDTQEVGTTVNLSASAKTASASANITYEGFDYGYSMENDNERDGEGNPSDVAVTGSVKSGSTYNLTFVTNNGFGSADVPDVTGSTTSNNALIVAEGTNKVTVTAKSPEFTATVPAQDLIYACSSLKKTDAEHVVEASSATTIEGASKSVTANTSITGSYKLYVGYTDSEVSDSDGIKNLTTQTGWTNGSSVVTLSSGTFPAGKYANIAMPSEWLLKEVKNGMDLVITDNFGKVSTISYTLPDGTSVDYKVYSNLYGKDVAYNSIKIGK